VACTTKVFQGGAANGSDEANQKKLESTWEGWLYLRRVIPSRLPQLDVLHLVSTLLEQEQESPIGMTLHFFCEMREE